MPEVLARFDEDYVTDAPRPRARAPGRKAARPASASNGLLARVRRHPVRSLTGGVFIALLCGIVVNATLMQSGHHPAPLFAGVAPAPAAAIMPPPAAAPSPVVMAAPSPAPRPNDITTFLQTGLPRAAAPAPAAHVAPPAREHSDAAVAHKDAIAALLKADMKTETPTEKPARVAAVQRALQKVGFVVKPDGNFGATTRQALERFERDRGLTVTGELSPRTVRELAAQSGVAIP